MKNRKISFKTTDFAELVKNDADLKAIRRAYAKKSPGERRMAADWEYNAEMGSELFNNMLVRSGQSEFGKPCWPAGIKSLAIDPLYAPALLTVGSLEYQLGRKEQAMELFITLTTLPEDEDDLSEIIDKAGDFLIDEDDIQGALDMYVAAEKAYPNIPAYPNGVGYCLSKLGRYQDALEKIRRVDALEPDNYLHLNDLGWALVEAGYFEEAEKTLKRSMTLGPEDYEFPQNNLKELRKRRANQSQS